MLALSTVKDIFFAFAFFGAQNLYCTEILSPSLGVGPVGLPTSAGGFP